MIIEPVKGALTVMNTNGVQRVYQAVEVADEFGEIEVVKFQATKEFKEALNGLFYAVLEASIRNAMDKNRLTLWPKDLPLLDELEREEEEEEEDGE